MTRSKSVYAKRALILLATCASVVGCSAINPVNQTAECPAIEPVLINTTVSDVAFIVPVDEMGQITAYIEALRQCVYE